MGLVRRNFLFTYRYSFPSAGEREETSIQSELALPVDLLTVVVHQNRKKMAAFGAAAFDHISATSGGHSFSEPMDTHPTAYLGLVGSFRHVRSFIQKR